MPSEPRTEADPALDPAAGLGGVEAELNAAMERVQELLGELSLQARVGLDQLKGGVRRSMQRTLAMAISVLLVCTWSVSGAWSVAQGIQAAIAGLGLGPPWLQQILGGLVVLGLVGSGLLLARALHGRARLRRARRKYGEGQAP